MTQSMIMGSMERRRKKSMVRSGREKATLSIRNGRCRWTLRTTRCTANLSSMPAG